MGAGEAMAFTESDFQSEWNIPRKFTSWIYSTFGWGNCFFMRHVRVVFYLWLDVLRCPPLGPHPFFVVTTWNWAREIYDFAFYPGNPRELESIRKVSVLRIEKVWESFLWHQKSWSDLGPGARFYSNCPGQIRKQGLGQKSCHFHFVCYWFGLWFLESG